MKKIVKHWWRNFVWLFFVTRTDVLFAGIMVYVPGSYVYEVCRELREGA